MDVQRSYGIKTVLVKWCNFLKTDFNLSSSNLDYFVPVVDGYVDSVVFFTFSNMQEYI